VSAYARALTANRTVAEDAVQETFLRAWRYLHTYNSAGSLEGWLLTICRRCVIDLAQRDERHATTVTPLLASTDADHSVDIIELIAGLPLPQREVLVLCGWLGYDYDAAAAILDVPVGTIRSRLHRARAALADILAFADECTGTDTA
jgi:RNA polymerase sigma-70 factor (ECF subfamily)